MKPAAFAYFRPDSVDEVVGLLAEGGGDAKILAGGQSLVPLLNFRMLRPAMLIDINRVAELSFVEAADCGLRIGALTRHHTLETLPLMRERFPVVSNAVAHVAHLAIRNRGTIGGSLAHADPAAELPMMATLLDAAIHTRSPSGETVYEAADFFLGPLTSTLGEDEIVTEIRLPYLPAGTGWAFEEFAQRSGDFAIAAAAVTVTMDGDKIAAARIALMGVDETPLRLRDVEAHLVGEVPTSALAKAVAARARAVVNPNSDLKSSADYRRHLVAALTERVFVQACRRAGSPS